MPFPTTYYTNILGTVMCSRSSNLTSGTAFLKMGILIILKKKYCVHITINYNISKYPAGTEMGLGFVKQVTVKSHITCTDEATASNMFF
jgi:hypothetical protein